MSRKSLVINAYFEVAKAAHDCQGNSAHRLQKGDIRLSVKNKRSRDNYCKACADIIIAKDLEKLSALQQSAESVNGTL